MEYIIHLTERCNLNCKYCYEDKKDRNISFEDIKSLIDYEINCKNEYVVIFFYGGEPLLQKKMIMKIIDYINSKKSKTEFFYGITTNGTLLDDEFIQYMSKNRFINIAYSIDGIEECHNLNRKTIDGKGTFEIVRKNALKVLKTFSSANSMTVITKNNLKFLSANVEYLIKIGFKNINLLFDYSQDWDDEDLKEIRNQFDKVAKIYAKKILEECDIEISIIDKKIETYVKDDYDCNDECLLGMKTINIGVDGNMYPCMQFVNNSDFIIGNCTNGIDKKARQKLIRNSHTENETCKNCAIKKRCKHICGCKNYITTRNINGLSPVICETEKILIEISDKMANFLYKQNSKLFLQKYYNKNYFAIKQLISKGNKKGGFYENKKCY